MAASLALGLLVVLALHLMGSGVGGAVNIKSLSGDSGTVNMYSKDLNITSPGNNDKLGADITGNGGTI
ncbi:MAG: hypothetical protein M3Z59_01805, partial [Bombella apis]|nr:hypothetical protein [Bombella apis]